MGGQAPAEIYFPGPGSGIECQSQLPASALGVSDRLVARIASFASANQDDRVVAQPRWAIWRWGHLLHYEGDFEAPIDVASNRKTWHAMIVGAALQQGRIESLDQPLSEWLPALRGRHRRATWQHVLTQSSGFDYPHGEHPAYDPGVIWTYSDWNLVHLCNALAKVYGRADFFDRYELVARQALFDAIGMRDWGTTILFDPLSGMKDGVRFLFSLEHLGRLGTLMIARGAWEGRQLASEAFVRQLERKQTAGMRVNYKGPYDGDVGLSEAQFPTPPYGYLTWTNSAGDLFPGADRGWVCASGRGGMITLWNARWGIVFAGFGCNMSIGAPDSLAQIIDNAVLA